ncbi:transporter substrate-binding domain-containing protein [Telmatospirillum sp.]|uniref:transporter substrate-binding domain-containing protein n=1 Tax=Telmatospirillum sp. TaxID=2079197 RepID=UPI00283C51E4|nr:transporter substrate-binding domain-containing protein [Telmatospirillum sp.]MDR3436963.1 transporter substrate-binding domain-containing protein [Telmatospirillum sp.]
MLQPSFRTIARKVILAFAVFAFTAAPALAQTVDDILKKGKLTVGMLVDLPPFGLMTDGKPDGYDADVAKLMAKYLGVDLEIVPVTGPNRIPYLLTGKVDMLTATFGITPERAKQVQFSIPYSTIEIQLLGPKDTKITSFDDIANKKVSVARASSQDTALTAQAPKSTTILRFDDDASAGQAYLSGQADLIGSNNVTALQLAATNPPKGLEKKLALRSQYQGITLRRGSDDLRQWVNTFLFFIKNNGELDAINQKWFHEPLPPLPVF